MIETIDPKTSALQRMQRALSVAADGSRVVYIVKTQTSAEHNMPKLSKLALAMPNSRVFRAARRVVLGNGGMVQIIIGNRDTIEDALKGREYTHAFVEKSHDVGRNLAIETALRFGLRKPRK